MTVPTARPTGGPGPRRAPTPTPPATARTRCCSASPGRCAPPGCTSPRTARTASSRRSRCSASTTSAATYLRRPGDPVRRPRRPRALRPGLRGLVRRPRRAAPHPAGRSAVRPDVLRAAGHRRRRRRRARPTTRWCGRWPATPRCCGTATWRACRRPSGPGSPACSRRSARGRRCGAPPGTRPGTAATSTPPATLRASLRRLGEPAEIAWRRRGVRPRRVVLLVDVSGSMSAYADALLRLAHRFTQAARERGGVVEVFTIGHPADPRDPGAAAARPRAGAGRGGGDRPGLVRRHPARGDARASSSTAGASAAWPAAPSSWSSATAGSAATRRCSASRCGGCTASPTGWSG